MTEIDSTGAFDFDAAVDRLGTDSIKWSGLEAGALAMHLADMDLRTAPVVIDALRDRVEHGAFGYGQATAAFTEAIEGWLKQRRGWPIEPEWMVTTSGVMPAIAHLLRAWLEPGDSVVVQTPRFEPIPEVVTANGFRIVEHALQLVDGRYEMDIASFEELARRDDVRAFVLCSPHNPSGRVWSSTELEALAAVCDAHDLLVISDEVHADIVFPWARFTTYGRVAANARHAVVFGPSKGFNLAGLRLAITVVPDARLRAALGAELHRVNEDFGIPVMGAAAVAAAYGEGGPWLDALTHYLHGNIDELTAGLAGVDGVGVVRPDASFLVWLDVRAVGVSDVELTGRLAANGVIVEPGSSFGPAGEGFLRVNIGTPRSNVASAVARMIDTFAHR